MMNGILGKCNRWCHNKSVGVLLLRVVLGAFFVAHGANKFLHMQDMVSFFDSIGMAPYWAYVSASVEVLGGAMLLLGAFAWVAAIMLTIEMIVAMVKVTIPSGSGSPPLVQFIASWGPNVIYAAAALCIALCGSGRYSLTAWYMKRKGGGTCKDCASDHGVLASAEPMQAL